MIRLRMSRPNSSVPSAWRSTTPGPLRTASENWADGLSGAMSGAAAAITIMASASSAPMPMGSQRRRTARTAPRAGSAGAAATRSTGSAWRAMAIVGYR